MIDWSLAAYLERKCAEMVEGFLHAWKRKRKQFRSREIRRVGQKNGEEARSKVCLPSSSGRGGEFLILAILTLSRTV